MTTLTASLQAPNQIFSTCNWLKVVRIHARRVATQMIKLETIWDRADMNQVENLVGVPSPVRLSGSLSIPISKYGARPQPASRFMDSVSPQSSSQCFRISFSLGALLAIMALTQPSTQSSRGARSIGSQTHGAIVAKEGA